jgi:hypothetical protein
MQLLTENFAEKLRDQLADRQSTKHEQDRQVEQDKSNDVVRQRQQGEQQRQVFVR